MKKLISKFSDKLLSNQQLKTVKGGNYYCTCAGGAPINTSSQTACYNLCYPNGSGGGGSGSTCGHMQKWNNYLATGHYIC